MGTSKTISMQNLQAVVVAVALLAVIDYVQADASCNSRACRPPRTATYPLCCDPKVKWIQTEVTSRDHPIRTKYVEVDVRWRDDVGTLTCPCDPPLCKKPARYMWERVIWRPPKGWCEDRFEESRRNRCVMYISHWCFGGPKKFKYLVERSKKNCPATCGYCQLYSKRKQNQDKHKRETSELFQISESNWFNGSAEEQNTENQHLQKGLTPSKDETQSPHVAWNTFDDVSTNEVNMDYVHTDFDTMTVSEDRNILRQRSRRSASAVGCMGNLGLKDGRVLNSHMKASSVFVSTRRFSAHNARLDHKSAWCASKIKSDIENIDQYLEIKFPFVMKLTGVATQGLQGSDFWVKYYWVKHSSDGTNWKEYNNDKGKRMIFPGNVNSKLAKYNRFKTTVLAKYIRIYPSDWHSMACLRLELYGCKAECMDPIGLYDGRVKDWQITVSLSRTDMTKTGKYTPRLHDFHGFCASKQDLQQYIQVAFKQTTRISGIASQGDTLQDLWVISFKIRYSKDHKSFTDYSEDGPVKVFTANTDRYSVVENYFLNPFSAKSVRVHPLSWNVRICIRIELYGCPYVAGKC